MCFLASCNRWRLNVQVGFQPLSYVSRESRLTCSRSAGSVAQATRICFPIAGLQVAVVGGVRASLCGA